jgi:glycosyltransferase involved in cell wall biosynthesis
MRILYSSNAFWASSGYGVQGRSLLPRLAALPQVGGVDNIAMFAWYGLQGGMHEVNGIRVYPAGVDPYGNDIIEAHTKNFRADVMISLIDVWVMKETARKVAPAKWLPWLPIDHDPVPQLVLDALPGAHLPLVYSKWGVDLLRQAGVESLYMPCGLEPSVYYVDCNVVKVAEVKRALMRGLDGGHLTVMVAANKGYPDRKWFQGQLRAWSKFAADKPDARLYIHSEPTTMYGGIDFGALITSIGIQDKVLFPERYVNFIGLPAEQLALVYNAADVLLSASMSEGFGIPIIEAQACGTPVVVTDFSAMPELVRTGYKVAPADKFWTPLNAWQAWPDANGITDALNELYAQWESHGRAWPLAQRLRTSDTIHQEFDWDVIVREHWGPLLMGLQPVAEAIVAPAAPSRNGDHAPRRLQPVGL